MADVTDLLGLPSFQGAKVIAGSGGLGAAVKDISIMEVPDIEDYVNEGDFLLTTLYPLSSSIDELDSFIERMKRAGLSGIGVKLNRYVSSMPENSIGRANDLGFPVVLLPRDANFSLMINDFLKTSLRKKTRELEHRDFVHNLVMDILLSGGAPRAIAKALSGNLERCVVFYDSSYEVLAEHNPHKGWSARPDELVAAARALKTARGVSYRSLPSGHCALYGMRFGGKLSGVIAVCSPEEFALEGDQIVTLQQFAIAFRIAVQQRIMSGYTMREKKNSFASDLFSGAIESEEAARNQASFLKWKLSYPLSILAFDVSLSEGASTNRHETTETLGKRVNQRLFGKADDEAIFWTVNGASSVVMLSGSSRVGEKDVVRALEEEIAAMGASAYHVAQSGRAEGFSDIQTVYRECEYTLRLSKKLGDAGCSRFQDLGVYRMIYFSKSKDELRSFCNDVLGKLIEYDLVHSSNLLQTIEVVFECNKNLKAASERLFVHYNTVRYRYRLAEQILGISFENPDEFQTIALALKVHRVLPSI